MPLHFSIGTASSAHQSTLLHSFTELLHRELGKDDTTDVDQNEIPDCLEGDDCNDNGIPDECDIADRTSEDCNDNGIPDACELEGAAGGSVFLTGHDPDFHAVDQVGPRNINIAAIGFVMDPMPNRVDSVFGAWSSQLANP